MVSKPAAMKNLRIPVSLARESKAWYRLESVLEKKGYYKLLQSFRIQYTRSRNIRWVFNFFIFIGIINQQN